MSNSKRKSKRKDYLKIPLYDCFYNYALTYKKPGDTLSFLVRYLMESIFLSRIITMKSLLSSDE